MNENPGSEPHPQPSADSPYLRAIDLTCLVLLLAIFAWTVGLRLARPSTVRDGFVVVEARPAGDPAPADEREAAAAVEQLIDPNTAEWWELTELPGIGEVRAQAIVEYRTQFRDDALRSRPDEPPPRAFERAEDLAAIRGIGPKTVERLRPLLTFGPRTVTAAATVPPEAHE